MTGVNENRSAAFAAEANANIDSAPKAEPKNPAWLTFAAIAVLLAINLACYSRSLKGYFLADDFIHIPYLAEVFRGHPQLLLKNFTSNWMQTEGTQFYRPLISITLAIDYAFWHVNAIGYHVTNLLLQIASSIFLFLASRRIYRSFAIGCAAGALFAAFPLHPEVVSWIIARVDSVATAFYLGAFWLFLRASQDPKNAWSARLSLICFALSLLSKETAITLPAALAAYGFFFAPEPGFKNRMRFAFSSTRFYWLMLFGYLAVRTAALGTFTGGYKGSIGSGLSDSFVHRFFGDGSSLRVLYPLNADVFAGGDKTKRYLRLLYEVAAGAIVLRTFLSARAGQIRDWLRDLAFPMSWFIIAMVPAYQVWNLTETLQGSRFIYMATAPLCLLYAVLLSPMAARAKAASVAPKARLAIDSVCALLTIALVGIYASMATRNNEPWVKAGMGVKALKDSMTKCLSAAPKQHVALLNLPQRYRGAHMLYNGAMFSILMSPPLSNANYSHRIATFEPVMYGDSDLLNTTRLKRLIAAPDNYVPYRWDETAGDAVPINLSAVTSSTQSTVSNGCEITNEHPFVSPPLSLSPLAVDLVKVELSLAKPTKGACLQLAWTTPFDGDFANERSFVLPLAQSTAPQTVTFSVSDRKRWVSSELIDKLRISLPAPDSAATVRSIVVESGEHQIPKLSLNLGKQNSRGERPHEDEFGVTWTGSVIGPLSFDVSKIPGATAAMFELSKRDCWFEHYSGVSREMKPAAEVLQRGTVPAPDKLKSDNAEIKPIGVSQGGYYELRIFAVDKDGKTIGYCSDPINLWLEPPSGEKPHRSGTKHAKDAGAESNNNLKP